MGLCSSLCGGSDEGRYAKATELAQRPAQPPANAKSKQQHREANWKATGIIGLRDMGLKELPAQVVTVGLDARVLDATNNKLKEVPPQLGQLPNLQRLVLAQNSLQSIVNLPCLPNLKVLDLTGNMLVELPSIVCQLTRLEKLLVTSNQLSSLPSGMSAMVKLQFLNCSSNKLTALPEDLPPAIEELDASNNSIQAIPPSLASLSKLKVLNLDSNQVSSIPPEVLLHCEALQTLSLHSNPITPDELQSNPAFTAFEERRRSKYNKAISGGVMLGSRGLDEGVDRKAMRSP